MTRAPIIYVSLLCFVPGARAQDASDLFSLTFTPGPIADEAAAVTSIDVSAAASETDERDERRIGLIDSIDSIEQIEQIEESIGEEESLNGRRSPALVDDLAALAAAYQELGEALPAMALLERARHLSRIHDGLHSLEQAGILEQMIESVQAAGRFSEADSLQDTLLELASRNEGDRRAPSLMAAVAQRQLDAVNEYLKEGTWAGSREPLRAAEGSGWDPSTPKAGRDKAVPRLGEVRNSYDAAVQHALKSDDYELGDPLELDTGLDETYFMIDTVNEFVEVGRLPRRRPPEWEADPPESDREWALAALRRARRLYSSAMQQALSQESYAEYMVLEKQLLETYYFEMANPELHPSHVYERKPRRRGLGGVIYLTGASVLEAKVVERLSRGASAVDVARALVELGDWHLLFSFNGTALDTYRDGYDLLVKEEAPAESVAELFSADVPAILPAFASGAESFDPARRYRGHFDVSIEIGRYGESKRIEVLDASHGATKAVERRLRKHIAQTRFRPRFVDGRPARSDSFSRRYYFDY